MDNKQLIDNWKKNKTFDELTDIAINLLKACRNTMAYLDGEFGGVDDDLKSAVNKAEE